MPVGLDHPRQHWLAVDDHLHRHLPRGADSSSLEMPVGLVVEAPGADCLRCRRRLCVSQEGRDVTGHRHRAGLVEDARAQLAAIPRLPHRHVIDAELEDMREAVATVAAAILDPLHPGIEIERLPLVELHVDPPQPHPVTVDAGEVGLAADPRREAAIECVVPNVELPHRWRVDGREKIAHAGRRRDNVLIGADPVEAGHGVIGELRRGLSRPVARRPLATELAASPRHHVGEFESPAGMAVTDNAPLLPPPGKDRLRPTRPLLDERRAGVVVLGKSEKTEVAGVRRREAAHLDVVAHQRFRRREGRWLSLEVLFLDIPTRPPGEDAADVEILADDVPHHVGRADAGGGVFIVGAAGGVDVVVAGEPAAQRRLDPAFEAEIFAVRCHAGRDRDRRPLHPVFGATGELNGVIPGGKRDRLAVGPVDLIVEEEVGGETTGGIGMDAAEPVAEHERRGCRSAVVVTDAEGHRHRRKTFKEDRDGGPEAEILRPLADVEPERRLALPGVAGMELKDAVFEGEPRQLVFQRL